MDDHLLPDPGGFALRRTACGPEATEDLGRRAALLLAGGEVILLYGDLGAGKTCFTRGLCRGLETDLEAVSPTFTLVNTYLGKLRVLHLDFYRIEPDADLEDVGVSGVLEEVWDGGAVVVAEWPERLLEVLGDLPRIELLAVPGPEPDSRVWHLRGHPDLPAGWRELWTGKDDAC
jgi:tRNA threonylcarbamoyladenosine biosynthesis protein TsaE